MKSCSFCDERIQDVAIRCPHCKRWLVSSDRLDDTNPVGQRAAYPSTSGLAIASMVLGIVWIYWIGSITGLVLGYLALREIRQDPLHLEGRGMALAGIVLGWIGVATLVVAIGLGVYVWKNEKHPVRREVRGAHVLLEQGGLVSRRSGR